MKNERYIKRGSVIDIQIRDEYFASANISATNKERTEFKCELSIHDTESGMSVELDKTATLSSTFKTVNKDVADKLNELIKNGYFDEDVVNIENMVGCLNALLEFQKKLKTNRKPNTNHQYSFKSEFSDTSDSILRVNCEDEINKVNFNILIDTYDDPYLLYFSNLNPDDEANFRNNLFSYLLKKYPEHFGY